MLSQFLSLPLTYFFACLLFCSSLFLTLMVYTALLAHCILQQMAAPNFQLFKFKIDLFSPFPESLLLASFQHNTSLLNTHKLCFVKCLFSSSATTTLIHLFYFSCCIFHSFSHYIFHFFIIFHYRYGCPGSVSEDYSAFADFYDKHFAGFNFCNLHPFFSFDLKIPYVNNGHLIFATSGIMYLPLSQISSRFLQETFYFLSNLLLKSVNFFHLCRYEL